MSTVLLHYQDDYLSSFEATVLSKDNGSQSVVLDSTAFYPTGGHQRCDQGRIEKNRKNYMVVTDVQKDDSGLVRHYYAALQGNIQPGDKIKGVVHWKRRFRHMQLHTAQHIFSRYARNRFGIKTGRADFSPEGGIVVMEIPLSWEQILLLEDDVNQLIAQGRGVSRSIDREGVITITIDQFDENHCGGTHVRLTSEIEMFKITRVQDRNIYYEIGKRAKRLAIRVANNAIETASFLGLEDAKDLTKVVNKLTLERDQAHQKLDDWKEQTTQRQISIANQTVAQVNDGTAIFQLDLSHMRTKAVKRLLKKQLVKKNQVWVCMADRRNILITSSTSVIDANKVLQEFADKWGMRGGGNSGFAQGGPIPEQIAAPLEKVAKWILS